MNQNEAPSELAESVREYRDWLDRQVCPDQDHLDSVVGAKEFRDDLDEMLERADVEAPSVELTVEFRQRFTVRPPAEITDPGHAADWFWNQYDHIGVDVVDTRDSDHYEVVGVAPEGWSDVE